MQSSGLLVVSQTLAESQVSIAIDDTELQASVALKKTTVWKYMKTFVDFTFVTLMMSLNLSMDVTPCMIIQCCCFFRIKMKQCLV